MERRWRRERFYVCSTTIQGWALCGTRMRATSWRSRRRANAGFIFRWRRSRLTMGHVIPILEWIAGLGLVVAIVVQIFQNRYRAIEAKSWPTAQATIQPGGMEPVNSGERRAVILPCFAFSYVVNGEYYSGRFSL